MKWALVDANNICQNIVAYNGASPYTPPASYTLTQVNDWIDIGHPINEAQPAPYVAPLVDRRRGAIAALVAMRDSKTTADITYNGTIFHCTDNDMAWLSQTIIGELIRVSVTNINVLTVNINVLVPAITSAFPLQLQTANGFVQLTLVDAKSLLQACLARKQANMVRYMALLAIINSSNTPESVDINGGWS